ncbi:MAG: Asp-tRNA(Asn)/Glu-tRNA(Gln) amidotransferase subunit GatB [Candidatus Latescibacteria bacterium]|nr:Asp-tRNA(Asn)/Glu-tRNA(Gln) amidotransferase subunit GatB [Candidatus Latescibacterota bacterium]
MKYIPTVGLEIHSQLATKTKIFCGCPTAFGGESNTHGCPVCLGMPGVLPVLNKHAVELAMRMALLTNGEIQKRSYFARKNYFYPDLPKGYQISMFEFPLIKGGYIDLKTENGPKRIRFNRIHMEEDAGKLIHVEGDIESYFDVNRCGVPLIETVTEPDFGTLEQVSLFLNQLKELLIFSGASLGNMEQGNIRVDANISIRPQGQKELNTRTEIKNMNSFVNALAAIEHEIARQTDIVEQGKKVIQETLLYDPVHGIIAPMRSKEEAHDYRYFPEPDLVPVFVDDEWIDRIRSELPEMRNEKRNRFIQEHGLPEYDAEILTTSPDIAKYYELVIGEGADPKKASNWVMGEVLRILNETRITIDEFKVKPSMLAELLIMIDNGSISGSMAKTVFDEMASNGRHPKIIVAEKGLTQISDKGELKKVIREVIESNPNEVEKYKSGKTNLIAFFVGQVMKMTRGKANPQEVNVILREMLS